jgi:hypothetical protein
LTPVPFFLPAYSVIDKDYRFLGRFSNLEVLCLRDIDLDKVRFEFPVLPKLVEICIDDNRVTPRVGMASPAAAIKNGKAMVGVFYR